MEEGQEKITCDLLVVGGGINGAGIARDAAGRGLSVVLCEKDDLAAHTSSASSKLIHGGLRYLEHYEFGLVRKALIEREILLRSAPHIMWPLRFVLPHDQGQRPYWMIRTGLFLYDALARRELLPGSCGLDLRRHVSGKPLRPAFMRGFVYSDGWVDDARLVILNAVDADERGATVLTRTRCVSAQRQGDHWIAELLTGENRSVRVNTRCLVNAAGPWAAQFLQMAACCPAGKALRLVKGSHIIVPRLFDHPYAYLFQHPDGRVVFAIPFQHDFTLVGTTEIEYCGDPGEVAIDDDEIFYLCDLVNRYFRKPLVPSDVICAYSGVRPLVDDDSSDASAVTRDYRLDLDRNGAPMLSVFGGKITTYRRLAEEAVDMLAPLLPMRRGRWTANACLPGGDLFDVGPANRSVLQFDTYVGNLQRKFAWLSPALVARYARAYGTRTHALLAGCRRIGDLGDEIAPGLFETEMNYLMQREWATTADDILWRRSKLGLRLPAAAVAKLDSWMRTNRIMQEVRAIRA